MFLQLLHIDIVVISFIFRFIGNREWETYKETKRIRTKKNQSNEWKQKLRLNRKKTSDKMKKTTKQEYILLLQAIIVLGICRTPVSASVYFDTVFYSPWGKYMWKHFC